MRSLPYTNSQKRSLCLNVCIGGGRPEKSHFIVTEGESIPDAGSLVRSPGPEVRIKAGEQGPGVPDTAQRE